jgi:hypothetical protein
MEIIRVFAIVESSCSSGLLRQRNRVKKWVQRNELSESEAEASVEEASVLSFWICINSKQMHLHLFMTKFRYLEDAILIYTDEECFVHIQ